jgi:glycosyltransferase involved in cell wall biosynthesis
MKILHVSTGYPISYQGGITNYVRMLANEQYNNGDDVWVLGGKDNEKHKFKYVEYSSNKIQPFTLGKLEDKNSLGKLKELFDKEKFDLIHIHMMLDIDWDFTNILKGYKYIISLHDYFYLCPRIIMMDNNSKLCIKYERENCRNCISKFEQGNIYRGVNLVKKKLKLRELKVPMIPQKMTDIKYEKSKSLLENADLLLPVSNRVKEIYEMSGINGKYKVLHIGNNSAYEYKKYRKSDAQVGKGEEINIVILGALNYFKGAEVLIKILKNINNKDIKFHFYGRANEEYFNEAQKFGLIDHGSYKQSQLKEILNNMDLGMVLSVWEDNAPQVVMELLNNNVPVIGTKMGGIPDFISRENGYLFNPYSEKEFEGLIEFLDNLNKDKIYSLKENITRTKTPHEHLKELNDIYNEIIRKK